MAKKTGDAETLVVNVRNQGLARLLLNVDDGEGVPGRQERIQTE